jgi:DNA-binding transcriptional regulator GbsR (MarR family)
MQILSRWTSITDPSILSYVAVGRSRKSGAVVARPALYRTPGEGMPVNIREKPQSGFLTFQNFLKTAWRGRTRRIPLPGTAPFPDCRKEVLEMSKPRTPRIVRPDPVDAETLAVAKQHFIALWGQMGAKWGIPRTMAEVHALLFIEGRPMNTDEVMAELRISRGSASTTLRSLVEWSIVQRVHQPGDRKEYFEAEQDVWKMFRTIARERKKREIDPLLEALHECRQATAGEPAGREVSAERLREHNRRLDGMLELLHVMDSVSRRFVSPMGKGLEVAARILARAS